MTMPRQVLVTGATGFVGRALVEALVRQGTSVVAATRRDVAGLGTRTVNVGDIDGNTDWAGALSGCDAVAHLAARVHVMRDKSGDPLTEYRRVNVEGSIALARQAAAAGVRRFVYVSSIKVNGEASPPGRPFTESDSPAPADPYGISKAEGEAALFAVAREAGMDMVVVRPPLVYGPGVKANFLSMTRWLSRGLPLPLGGVTSNRRSLVGLDNLVDFLHRCLEHPAAAQQVFLVSDGEDLSTTQLLRRTAAALGRSARLVPIPESVLSIGATLLGRRDIFQRLGGNLQVDISKARKLLDWSPPFSVDEELRRTVATDPATSR
jgi:nucleoside-diphosphate-sugar epimerase